MLPRPQLAAVLKDIPLVSAHGPWSRALGYRHLLGPPPGQTGTPQPLWGGGAKIAGARFTPASAFDSIYLASDPITAFIEVSALVLLPGGPVPVRSAPWVVISVDGILNNLLDLTNAATLSALDTSVQEMTGTWVSLSSPPTQQLGLLAYGSGRIAGIQYASAKRPSGINVVEFPDRLPHAPGSYLEVYDPHSHLGQRLP